MKRLVLGLGLVWGLAFSAWGFNWEDFPDVAGMNPNLKVIDQEMNVLWDLYRMPDGQIVGIGKVPKIPCTPMVIMTPFGPKRRLICDTDGVPPTWYWMDLNKNGHPYQREPLKSPLDSDELLHDPAGDGLNGNETVPIAVHRDTTTEG